MKLVEPSFHIETQFDGLELLKEIERYARNCYKSEGKITDDSALPFVRRLLHTNHHEGITDHHNITVRIICDRGVSHELVRHRIAAYLQESTRYCDYGKVGEIQCIQPPDLTPEQARIWKTAVERAEISYNTLRQLGCGPQIARAVLPNSLKTEVITTMNLRSWRNFFRLRTAPNAHPQMRQIAVPLLAEFKRRIPVIFEDL